MAYYRDYGSIGTADAPNVEVNTKKYTQVYTATHKGDERIPFMYRSFISFSYGEKFNTNTQQMEPVYIEDFNLLATIDGDRLTRDAYSSFDDLTTTYDTIQGQFYWGSYYRTNSLTLNLSTDGMTQLQLDEFRHWFQPGPGKELILSEHPNRAIIARVSQPPQLKLLPFEEKVKVTLGWGTQMQGESTSLPKDYFTSTTLYKGEITLTFIMDEPFWYAKKNILGIQDTLAGFYTDEWIDANNQKVRVRDTPDALKIIYEDRIPLGSTTKVSVFLGGSVYAEIQYKLNSQIASPLQENEYTPHATDDDYYNDGNTTIPHTDIIKFPNPEGGAFQYYKGGVIAEMDGDVYLSGAKIGGAELSEVGNQGGITLSTGDIANLYYSGTAPSPVKLSFQLTPSFDSNNNNYITCPRSKLATPNNPENTIIFEATRKHYFKFTAPNLYTSYNRTIEVFNQFVKDTEAWLNIREYIRDLIKHPIVRAWANCVINRYDNTNTSGTVADTLAFYSWPTETLVNELINGMSTLFYSNNEQNTGLGDPYAAKFEFDSKVGKANGIFIVRDPSYADGAAIVSNWSEMSLSSEGGISELHTITLNENVGDMVKSTYLILDERNTLNNELQVQSWEATHPDYSYKITHDIGKELEHLQFEFQNLYL